MACDSLRKCETSIAIASGVNLVLNASNPLAGDNDAAVLAKDNRCKTFDEGTVESRIDAVYDMLWKL